MKLFEQMRREHEHGEGTNNGGRAQVFCVLISSKRSTDI